MSVGFVWTFEGIVEATGLALFCAILLLYLLAKLYLYIHDRRRKK